MSAWSGDWKRRILDFARRRGHAGVWEYLRANPGVPLVDLADRIGDAAAVQLDQLALAECFANRRMGELLCDRIARGVHQHLPGGWGSGSDVDQVEAVSFDGLHEPYRALWIDPRLR
jgi:hypothetical protein